jgi:tetratricopeptide (TPR) repeat protein/transcriptional regulator with XRE-family HTH domain
LARDGWERKGIGSRTELSAEVRRAVLDHERRIGRPVSRSALARAIGVSTSSLYAYLNGTTLPPTDTFDRLLGALGAPATERRRLCTARDELEIGGTPSAPAEPSRPRVPQELPMEVPGFTGRVEQLEELDRVLAGPRDGGAVPIMTIVGMPGVGKTALALRWAHRGRGRFPDGQLYVDLRGFGPGRPTGPDQALDTLLRSLGVPGGDIPAGLDQRAARFRTVTADRRLLIVLDNVRSIDQIRDLLPGSRSCVVLVTSRDSLAGLVARHGAHRIELGLLSEAETADLLRLLIGDHADTAGGMALADRCGRLPLALRVAAEIAAARPDVPLAELAAEIDEQLLGRYAVAGGDPYTALPAVFAWSYQHLTADEARLYRLLGVHPGRDTDAYAAAALAGTTVPRARHLLGRLAQAHLIHRERSDRYGMHDLLREHAAGLARDVDGEAERDAATARLLDHHLVTASAAMDALYPAERGRRPRIPAPAAAVRPLADPAAAQAWLDAERTTLLSLGRSAADRGWFAAVTALGRTLHRYLDLGSHHSEALALYDHTLRAAQQAGDDRAAASALLGAGSVQARLGRYDIAAEQLRAALAGLEPTGDRTGTARATLNLANVLHWSGRYHDAIDRYARALDLFGELGDRAGQASVLAGSGLVHHRLGDYVTALHYYDRALVLAREIGDPGSEAVALTNIGLVEQQRGRYAAAGRRHRQALAVYRRIGFCSGEANALTNLGDVCRHTGRYTAAADLHRHALKLAVAAEDPYVQACALNGLGETAHSAGHPDDALAHHRAALDVASEIKDPDERARSHVGLATAHEALADPSRALDHWRQALAIYGDLGAPQADEIRRRLAQPG